MTKETTGAIEHARKTQAALHGPVPLPQHNAILELAAENEKLADLNARLVALLRENIGADGPACGSTCVAPDDAELTCDLPAGHGERLCRVRSLMVGQRGHRYMWIDPDRRQDTLAVRSRALLAEIGGS